MPGAVADFSDQGLKRFSPSVFSPRDPSVVERLTLRCNQLRVLDPWVGSLFNQLQSLDLSSNQLRQIPSAICQLSILTSLNLDANQLLSLPAEIGELKDLKQLFCRGTKLRSLPQSLSHLHQLQHLDLTFNPLGKKLNAAFRSGRTYEDKVSYCVPCLS